MKGIVFTSFLDLVEEKFGMEISESLIIETNPESQGIYTAVGTYPFEELLNMVILLSKKTEIPIPTLLKVFGKHLFGVLAKNYGQFLENVDDVFTFLLSIESHIHVEVRKLYPDATLPTFNTDQVDEKTITMEYQSERKLGDLAEGLIEASFEYYKTEGTVTRKNIHEDGSKVLFTIQKI